MAWYKRAFSSTYLDVYSHRDDIEARQAFALVERTCFQGLDGRQREESLVLDLCCGQGRYTLLLARLGHRVVGLDLSRELLEKAHGRLLAESALSERVWFVQADMRCIPFSGTFAVAINMFTSFGYFDEDDRNFKVLRSLAQSLAPGGKFFIDSLNRPQVISGLVPQDSFRRGGLSVKQSRTITEDGRRVVKTVRVDGPSGAQQWLESVRMYSRAEMEQMLARAGLEVEEVFGGYPGQPHDDSSERLILTGRKNS